MTSPAYVDFSSLTSLKYQSSENPQSTLREVASQFESLFAHMVLKSMRATSMGDGLFDSKQSQFFRDMFDQQMSIELTNGKGLGLADMLVRQLEQYTPEQGPQTGSAAPIATSKTDFVQIIMPLAKAAAKKLNIDPDAIVAQAALETGWGKRVIQNAQGHSSHNLFGIKADSAWSGDRIAVRTVEVVDGSAETQYAPFRSYSTLAQAFDDYVDFFHKNPRYSKALEATDGERFVKDIHAAGYATDPDYGKKIIQIMRSEELQSALKDF